MQIEELENYIQEWIHIKDNLVMRILLGAVVINFCPTDPLWLFLIAPPSSLKTEVINSLRDCESIYSLSTLTPQTFLSGFKGKEDEDNQSLLFKINGKILTLKDFTTVLSMRWEQRTEILAQLREIYDGHYSKAFGNNKIIKWEGKVGFIAGVTPIIDTHYAIYQTLGERFVQYRMPPEDPIESSIAAMRNTGRESTMRTGIRKKVSAFITQFRNYSFDSDEMVSNEYINKIAYLSAFCVRARSGVERDRSSRDLIYTPASEAPPRLSKQLQLMGMGLTMVAGKRVMADAEYAGVFRVAMDCLPTTRHSVLSILKNKAKDYVNANKIAAEIKLPATTVRRVLEDLYTLHLVEKIDHPSEVWALSELSRNYLIPVIPQTTYSQV